jgi:hypothetical protein
VFVPPDVAPFGFAPSGIAPFDVVAAPEREARRRAGCVTGSAGGPDVDFFDAAGGCSPTAEFFSANTPPAPLACAVTGNSDTRPA